MINILPTHKTSFRTFGWVQDPSDFRHLCDVVAIFDNESQKHKELKKNIIPSLVLEKDGRIRFLEALNEKHLRIKYLDLVGTSFTPRNSARCNGIVQATVKGQKRDFIGDWPADNFVRWAYALGFIKYNYSDDTFEITKSGLILSKAKTSGKELNEIEQTSITSAVLAYPPAIRILTLLNENENTHLTKFEIGKQLGFIGEDGFTNLPQSVLMRQLAITDDAKEKNKMRTDWEGSSDKYARMTSMWLVKLGLVEKITKHIDVNIGYETVTEKIGQSYRITAKGITALNRALGKSKHKRIAKNICFEMLATKGSDREYLRTRRCYILKFISEAKSKISFEEIKLKLSDVKFYESIDTIKSDIKGLVNIGLSIEVDRNGCLWQDEINDFILPLAQHLTKSTLTELKDEVRPLITHISHEYLALIDLAYDSQQNRLFEMKTLELLVDECNYKGLHLGGSRKPDGIIFTDDISNNYGVIIDTKAYSKGYSLPISQADEMERYIRENQTRNKDINSNEWWNEFDEDIDKFYFMFISGHFKGNYKNQIERVSKITNTKGTSLNVRSLLLCANLYKSGKLTHKNIEEKVNSEYELIF